MTGPESESRASPGLETGCTANLTTATCGWTGIAGIAIDRRRLVSERRGRACEPTNREPAACRALRSELDSPLDRKRYTMSQQSNDLTPGHSLHRRRHVARGVVLVGGFGAPWTQSAPRFNRRSRHLASSGRARGQRADTSPAAARSGWRRPPRRNSRPRNPFAFGALPVVRRATPARMAAPEPEPAALAAAIVEPALGPGRPRRTSDGGRCGPYRGDQHRRTGLDHGRGGDRPARAVHGHLDRERRGGAE